MYNNIGVCLCNAILVTEIFCYRYSTIITTVGNNIFQRNLVIVLAIYCDLSVRNLAQIRLDLHFYLMMCMALLF